MAISDSKIEEYYRLRPGYLPVLSLQITQIPFELGEPSQVVQIEMLRPNSLSKLAIQFSGVADLEIARLHPGTMCLLQIASVVHAQLEGIRYQVFNGEQDFTLGFYCRDFVFAELEL